jgi:hypothetical protein
MTRKLVALAVVLAACAASAAHAQTYVPPRVSPYAPGFAPYLNLLRGGNQAVNYYGLVLPEIQGANAISQLQQQVAARPAMSLVAPPTNRPDIETGHVTRFMQYNQYFNTIRQQPGAAPPGTAARR